MKKNDFFRILSPITILVTVVLDIAIIAFAVFAVKKIMYLHNGFSYFFAICDLVAIVIGVLVTKSVLSQGVIFGDDQVEFNFLDEDNVFKYEDIKSISTSKDTKASLTKNFLDRTATIELVLKDDKVVTIDLGLITSKTLKKIDDKFSNLIGDKNDND